METVVTRADRRPRNPAFTDPGKKPASGRGDRSQAARRRAVLPLAMKTRYHGTRRVSHRKPMSKFSQQDFLKAAKAQLGLTWDELAEASGINPRALKTYRMPITSQDYRPMPDLARAAVSRLLEGLPKPRKKV